MATAFQFLQLHSVLTKPLAVGMCLGKLFLDLTVVVYFTILRVDEKDFSWLQTTFAHHISWLEVHHTHF